MFHDLNSGVSMAAPSYSAAVYYPNIAGYEHIVDPAGQHYYRQGNQYYIYDLQTGVLHLFRQAQPAAYQHASGAGPSNLAAQQGYGEDMDVDEDSVLVIRYCGPRGYPGMPETANVPLPAKLLKRGVRDIVRICDGRMSGTAYGTVVLHVAPEAAAGGALALVRTGDWITLDVPARTLALDVTDDELAARLAAAFRRFTAAGFFRQGPS